MEVSQLLYLKSTLALLIFFWNLDQSFGIKQCPNQDGILPCRCLVRADEYQIWCTHSDLPSVLGGLKSIAEHIRDPIDELILENNYLPSLPGRTFFSLRILRLMLRHNGLERVSSDWLTGLETILVEVFLVEPQLRSIPNDSFLKLNNLQAVTIQTKLLKHLPLFSGLNNLRYIQIESESLLDLSPLNFKNNHNLEKVHISSSPFLTKLSANTFVELPKLELINITNCGLNWIHARAFVGLIELKELSLVGNKLVDAGMVARANRELPKLEVIRLDVNNIDKLSEASFVDLPNVKEIHLSDNRISEILFGAFHRLPELKKLNLNRNAIRYIHPESFLQDTPNNLEELLLVDNRIRHIKELRSILNSLPRLLFLDMSYNNLKTIPFGAIRGHPTLEQLDMSFNQIDHIEKEAFMAMPALRELRLRNNSLSELIQPPFWNLPALKGLDLSGNLFRRIEPRLLQNLPSLRRLDLNGNRLTVLDPASFSPVPALEHINVSHNDIKILHPATFRSLLHLYELDASFNRLLQFIPGLPRGIENLHLHHNQIQEIPSLPTPDLDLPALRMLDLRFNRLETLHKKAFSTMPQLKKLFLGSNLLRSLDASTLHGLDRLEILHLGQNRLVNVHPHVLKHMKNLNRLNLNDNHIELLVPDLLKGVFNLKYLDISRNRLSEILPETLENNLQIEMLDASNNVLVRLPKSLGSLTNLKRIDLSNNRIKTIEVDILHGLENVRDLKLSKNYINELKSETFSKMKSVKSLLLDNNDLIYLEPNSFQLLPSLKSIKLNKNKIIEIPNLAFNRLSSLQLLELQDNDIRTIFPKAFNLLPQLLMLNLSNNKILNIDDAGLKMINSIELLDLSFNQISLLSSPVLGKMEWLVELRIDNNNICGIQGLEFLNMSRLRVLSLKNNKLVSFPETAIERQRSNLAILDLEGNPLICSCDLMWLQGWLQESSQSSPRCADGALLREIRFAREDCIEKNKLSLTASPGCDTELLTSSGNTQNSQIATRLTSLRNNTKENLTNKNNVALTPQESEYFYDEYVDYPFNESLVDGTVLNDVKNKDPQTIELTTSVPHNISGDTPTLYAMPRNKSKTIPQMVPDSPSSSGFTFFGIPLSGFNLNKILEAGVTRLEKKKTQPTAERKNAIMNQPQELPKRFAGNRNRPNNQVENQNFATYGSRNSYPPTIPQFQSGFKPMLPGSGGFKPILNPNLPPVQKPTTTEISLNSRKDFVEQTNDKPLLSSTTTSRPVSVARKPVSNSTEYLESQSVPEPTTAQNETDDNVTQTPKRTKGTQVFQSQTHTQSHITVLEENVFNNNETDGVGGVQSHRQFLATERKHHNVTKERNVEEATTTERYRTTSILPATTTTKLTTNTPFKATMESFIITAADEESKETTTIASLMQMQTQQIESLVGKSIGTPLSSLLASSGNRPFKNAVKSTITKVPSPLQEGRQNSRRDVAVSEPMSQREDRNYLPLNAEIEAITEKISDSNDWYFENYNKTNIKPFIGKITNSKEMISLEKAKYLVTSLIMMLVIVQQYIF